MQVVEILNMVQLQFRGIYNNRHKYCLYNTKNLRARKYQNWKELETDV